MSEGPYLCLQVTKVAPMSNPLPCTSFPRIIFHLWGPTLRAGGGVSIAIWKDGHVLKRGIDIGVFFCLFCPLFRCTWTQLKLNLTAKTKTWLVYNIHIYSYSNLTGLQYSYCCDGSSANEWVSELVYLTSLLNSQCLMSDGPAAGQRDEGWKCPRLEYTGFPTRYPVVWKSSGLSLDKVHRAFSKRKLIYAAILTSTWNHGSRIRIPHYTYA